MDENHGGCLRTRGIFRDIHKWQAVVEPPILLEATHQGIITFQNATSPTKSKRCFSALERHREDRNPGFAGSER
jgi:hypothetical protein